MASNSKVMFDLIINDKNGKATLNGISTEAQGAEINMGKLATGVGLASGGIAILASTISSSLSAFSTLEDGMAKVSTLYGDVEVNNDALKDSIQSLQIETGKTSAEISEGYYQALSAGIPVTEDMAEATKFMSQSTKLARGGFTSIDKAVDVTTSVLNAYGMEVEETEKVQDLLLQTQNKGKTTVDELASSLSQVTPTAAAMGVSFEDVSAAIATMTAQGTSTSSATTGLNQLLVELGKSGTAASETFEDLAGKSFQTFIEEGGNLGEAMKLMQLDADATDQTLIDMFGSVEAGKAALQIAAEDSSMFADNLKAMGNSSGSVAEANATMETSSVKVDKAIQAMDVAFTNAGETMMTVLGPALDWISQNAEWLAPLLLGIAVAIGVIVTILGVYIAVMAVVNVVTGIFAVIFSPIGITIMLVVAAIAALVIAAIYLYNNWDWIWEGIKNTVQVVWDFIVMAFTAVGEFLSGIWDYVYTTSSNVWTSILNALNSAINGIKNAFNSVWNFIKGVFQNIWNFVSGIATKIANVFKGIVNGISSGLQTAFNTVIGVIKSVLNTLLVNPINGAIGVINLIPGVNIGKLPQFAKGGIVNGSMLAEIGEAGPEAVIPLNKRGANALMPMVNEIMNLMGNVGGNANNNGETTVTINGDLAALVDYVDVEQGKRLA